MGSFVYGGKYPSAVKYNGNNVNYINYGGKTVWIKPWITLVNMTTASNLSYSVPISETYRIALVGGGGTKNSGGGGSGGYCWFDIWLGRGTNINFHCGGANDNSYATVSGKTHYGYHGGAGSGSWGGYNNQTWYNNPGGGGGHTDNGTNGNAGNDTNNGASVYDGKGAGGGGVGLCRMWIIGG